jgi:carbon storage regulator CsrA
MALVISRYVGEGVWIGPDIYVRLGNVKSSNSARIVIEAPPNIKIKRDESVKRYGRGILIGNTASHSSQPSESGTSLDPATGANAAINTN